MIGRLLRSLLGPAVEPESTGHLRRMGEQLTAQASGLRETALRGRTLALRAEGLAFEVSAWRRRLARARARGVVELVEAAAVQLGRLEGQLEATVRERDQLLGEELRARRTLVEYRQRWLSLIAEEQRMGNDTGSIVSHIDLTAPPPAADSGLLPEDEERDFVARAIDGLH